MRFILSLLSVACLTAEISHAERPPNVLFIALDDLRPELGCYGAPHAITPNMDALAARGTLFTRAYCNIPVCGASRASIMTGIRPTRTRFVDYDTRVFVDTPDAVTLSQHFLQSGYETLSYGKILHFPEDKKETWSQLPWRPDYPVIGEEQVNWRDYQSLENRVIAGQHKDGRALPWEMGDVGDDDYYDGRITRRAEEFFATREPDDQPFFLAVGFLKPHLPFNAPRKYWELYDPAKFTLPEDYRGPVDAPDVAVHGWGELRQYYGVPEQGPLSEEMAMKLVHGYHACVSYTDALVGRVIAALEASGEMENTIIILWGDHGFNLGDHSLWCKHSTFRSSLRVPLIVVAPGMAAGQKCDALVELVDVFPTLVDLTNTDGPGGLQGASFVPQLADAATPGKTDIFMQWKQAAAVKSGDLLFTRWSGDDGNVWAEMLFDHSKDPAELDNVVSDQEANAAKLRETLKRGAALAK